MTIISEEVDNPAKHLIGKILADDWKVTDRITPKYQIIGEYFIETYVVKRGEDTAYLKAIDYSSALDSDEPHIALQRQTAIFAFEANLMDVCQSKNMSKVVKILGKGKIPPPEGGRIPVEYMILEYSETSIPDRLEFDRQINSAWILKVLHNTAIGLRQLHQEGFAHTALAPDNIRVSNEELQKISELSFAQDKKGSNPHTIDAENSNSDFLTIETIYGYSEPDWAHNAQAKDAYNLGSLVFFLFTSFNFTTILQAVLPDQYHSKNFTDEYSKVIPHLEEALDISVEFLKSLIPDKNISEELGEIIRMLCHPDPKKRGTKINIDRIGQTSNLEPFITKLIRLSREVDVRNN